MNVRKDEEETTMRKRYWVIAVVTVFALALSAACAARSASAPEGAYDFVREEAPAEGIASIELEKAVVEDEGMPSRTGGGAEYAEIERLIIRNAHLDLVVRDTQGVLDTIAGIADRLGGYVVEANTYKYQEGLRASLSLRIPAEEFDGALGEIRELATEVRSESVSGQDVTEEYVDLRARLRNLERTAEKLEQFLDEAEDTEAALAVLEQLTRVTGEIEQVKGRMEFLQESAAMSSISVELTPDELAKPIEVGGWYPQGTARVAVQRLITISQGFVDALIVFVINVIPVLIYIAIPVVIVVFVIRAIVRRARARKARKAAKKAAEAAASEAGD
jgi:hypothetical protein